MITSVFDHVKESAKISYNKLVGKLLPDVSQKRGADIRRSGYLCLSVFTRNDLQE